MTPQSEPNYPELKPAPKTIENLYPQLSPDEQAEAAYTLKRYVALVWRIYQRARGQSAEASGKTEQSLKSEKFDESPFKR